MLTAAQIQALLQCHRVKKYLGQPKMGNAVAKGKRTNTLYKLSPVLFHETAVCLPHVIRRTEIPALLDSSVTDTPSVKILCPQTNNFFLTFSPKRNILRVGLLTF
jgi:hypothetical protein